MSGAYLDLDYTQVGLAALLVLINGAISLVLRLDLGQRLAVAGLRTVVQLLLVGLVLQAIFDLDHPAAVLGLMVFMVLTAGVAAVGRTERRYRGIFLDSTVSVWASSWLITALALVVIVQVEPWYRPQYAIPFLGMILGNTLTGVSLGLGSLGDGLRERRDEVEMYLALGATRWEAARPFVRRAVRTGMVPILNSMTVAGLVSLPGMMTGQILAGVAPAQAVKYQIVIMFLIASGTALGTLSRRAHRGGATAAGHASTRRASIRPPGGHRRPAPRGRTPGRSSPRESESRRPRAPARRGRTGACGSTPRARPLPRPARGRAGSGCTRRAAGAGCRSGAPRCRAVPAA